MRPEIASQELDALFVSLEGMSILRPFGESLLVDGEPVPDDGPIDGIGVGDRQRRRRRRV